MTYTAGGDVALYSLPEICRMTGCSQRQADYWARTMILVPSIPAQGSGSHRKWTMDEVAMARVCERLSLYGCTGAVMRAVVDSLRAFPELWSGEALVMSDGTVVPFGVHAGRDGWLINLAGARAWVGAEPVVWDGSTVGMDEIPA